MNGHTGAATNLATYNMVMEMAKIIMKKSKKVPNAS